MNYLAVIAGIMINLVTIIGQIIYDAAIAGTIKYLSAIIGQLIVHASIKGYIYNILLQS